MKTDKIILVFLSWINFIEGISVDLCAYFVQGGTCEASCEFEAVHAWGIPLCMHAPKNTGKCCIPLSHPLLKNRNKPKETTTTTTTTTTTIAISTTLPTTLDAFKTTKSQPKTANRKCGKSRKRSRVRRVVGGGRATSGSWPWQIALQMYTGEYLCGGVILNERWILTAAHCFQQFRLTKFVRSLEKRPSLYARNGFNTVTSCQLAAVRNDNAFSVILIDNTCDDHNFDLNIKDKFNIRNQTETNLLRVYLGSQKLHYDKSRRNHTRTIRNITQHPEFERNVESLSTDPITGRPMRFTRHLHDLALIELEDSLDFTRNIQPVCLPEVTNKTEESLDKNRECWVTGWGKGEDGGTLRDLHEVSGRVLDHVECGEKWGANFTDDVICFGDKGHGPCMGDSGSGLFCRHDKSESYYLAGIVSWGREDCAHDEHPSVLMGVASYKTWIDSVMDAS